MSLKKVSTMEDDYKKELESSEKEHEENEKNPYAQKIEEQQHEIDALKAQLGSGLNHNAHAQNNAYSNNNLYNRSNDPYPK